MRLLAATLAPAFLLVASPALASDHGHAHGGAPSKAAKGATKAATTSPDGKGAQIVMIDVTKDGFVPAKVSAKAGQPVKLVVTRRVDMTCATEIVMKDFGVNQPLPLDRTVAVTITPKKAGQHRFSCAHGHISGVLQVN